MPRRCAKRLKSLGCRTLEDAVIEDWLAVIYGREQGPDLIRAGRAARDWMCQPGVEGHNPAGFFFAAACGAKEPRRGRSPCPSGQRPSSIITG